MLTGKPTGKRLSGRPRGGQYYNGNWVVSPHERDNWRAFFNAALDLRFPPFR